MKSEFFKTLKYVWRSKNVWYFTATVRTKALFARTALGGFWLGLSNLLTIAALGSVYGTVFKVNSFSEYIVYLGIGLVSWNSLANSIRSAPTLFEKNALQLLNTNTKHIFYTLEEWAFQIQAYTQSFILVLLGLCFFQKNLFINLLSVGIPPLLNLILFMYWFPLLIALIGIRYKDFYQLIPVFLQLIFLLSPFLYSKETLGQLSWITSFNPFYYVIAMLRDALIYGVIFYKSVLLFLIFNVLGICFSISTLNRSKKILPFLI